MSGGEQARRVWMEGGGLLGPVDGDGVVNVKK